MTRWTNLLCERLQKAVLSSTGHRVEPSAAFKNGYMFKQKTGYSVKQYILRRRIGEAQIRLINSQDSVQVISESVGFEDASYFSRIFSKYIGLTPTEYRKYRTGS